MIIGTSFIGERLTRECFIGRKAYKSVLQSKKYRRGGIRPPPPALNMVKLIFSGGQTWITADILLRRASQVADNYKLFCTWNVKKNVQHCVEEMFHACCSVLYCVQVCFVDFWLFWGLSVSWTVPEFSTGEVRVLTRLGFMVYVWSNVL